MELKRSVVASLVLLMGLYQLPVLAETVAANPVASPDAAHESVDGFNMLGWVGSMGIVEQLQTIHRFSQSNSPVAIQALITALNSPFALARRKASRSLLEKARRATADEKIRLADALKQYLENSDPVVQRNIVRLMVDLNIPESVQNLKAFFKNSDKPLQMRAVDAMVDEQNHQNALKMVEQNTPYPEIRQEAVNSLQ